MRKLSGYGPSLIVLATAAIVLFVGPSAVHRLAYKQTEVRMVQASHRLEGTSILEEFNQAVQDIATFVEPSVVHISAQQAVPGVRGRASLSSGSGWIYDEEGHVVTNYHVVRDAERIEVQLASGTLREAQVIGSDRSTDIAVLKISPGNLHPALRRDVRSAPVAQGDLVFAFGSPFNFRFSMSSGIVSGQGRYVGVIGRTGYENFIQVDAAINPGNSGGPLTDHRGRVIGMNTAIATGRRTSFEEGQFAGIGLAIPLEMIVPVVDQIIEKGVVEKGFLGVTVTDIDRSFREEIGFADEGVRVRWVDPSGPADDAGVRANDIITAVDAQPVASMPQLRSIISSKLPGEMTALTIRRPGKNGIGEDHQISVRLARLDPLRAQGEIPQDQRPDRIPQIGIDRMITSTPPLAARLGVEYHPGVIVERLVSGSNLARRMRPGTTITSVWDRPVTSTETLIEELRNFVLLGRGARVGTVDPDGTVGSEMLRVEE